MSKSVQPEALSVPKKRPGPIKAARRRRMTLAWSVWFMSALFVFFQFYLQLSSGQIVNALMKSFALTPMGGGFLAGSYYYIYVLLQAPAGMLMDRYGPRSVLSIGAVIVCVGTILFSQASFASIAILGRVLMGAGAAFAFVGCLNLISKWFPMRRFAMMAAIVEGAGMLGAIIGGLWLADFIARVGWRSCMLITGILAGILAICLWLVVRNAPRRKAPKPVAVSAMDLWRGVKRLFRNPVTWINSIYSGILFSVVTVFIALWAIPFFEQAHHVSLFEATSIVCSLYVGVMLAGPLLGWLDARYPCRRLMMMLCALLASVLLFVVIFWVSMPIWFLVVLLFVIGIFSSGYVLTFAIANEIALEANRATSIGITNMICVGFAPILQPCIGYLMHAFDKKGASIGGVDASLLHFQWALSLIPFLLLIATALALFLPKRQKGFIKRKRRV